MSNDRIIDNIDKDKNSYFIKNNIDEMDNIYNNYLNMILIIISMKQIIFPMIYLHMILRIILMKQILFVIIDLQIINIKNMIK